MRLCAAIVLLAFSPAALWKSMTGETNSRAAAARGAQQYATRRFDEAARSFATAAKLAPGPRSAFNLGTAQIAAGRRTEGSAALAGAMKDPALRQAALYNRGNSALASKAYEYAVRDYTEALKLRPADRDAKRNLEIALNRLQQQRQQQQQQQQGSGSKPPKASPQPSPGGRKDERKKGPDQDAEALLRSVQQQEQEELARMKRTRSDPKAIGW